MGMENSCKSGRRGNGEGSIFYDEKEKKWIAKIMWTDTAGDRHIKKFSGKTKMIVKKKLDEFKKELLISGPDIKKVALTFQEYAEHWMESQVKSSLKPSSYMRKKVTMKYQVYPFIGNISITDLKFEDIQKMVNDLIAKDLSYSSIKKAYDNVNGCLLAYRVATRNTGMYNPCEGVVLPSAKKRSDADIVFYNEKERTQIVDEATREFKNGVPVLRYGWGIVVLMYTGMRMGELIALEWSDIDFENKTICISKNAVVVEDESGENKYKLLIQNTPKTDSSWRIIKANQKAIDALLKIKSFNWSKKIVMSTKNGTYLLPRNFERTFNSILKKTGLIAEDDGQCGLHALRHTFASMLFNNGCSIKLVSKILGHADTKITENIYIHLIEQQEVKAMEDIDKYST